MGEAFTRVPGLYVTVEDTVASFQRLLDGEMDHLPEEAFYFKRGPKQLKREQRFLHFNLLEDKRLKKKRKKLKIMKKKLGQHKHSHGQEDLNFEKDAQCVVKTT